MFEPKKGKDKILMFRMLKDMETKDAAKLALQTEHELSYEREVNTTQTKDGAIVTDGGMEVTMSISAVASADEVNGMLFEAVKKGETLECWEIDLSAKGSAENKYKALYMRGKLNSWSLPASVEDLVEVETEMNIDGIPQEGEVTLTAEQTELILYAFQDLSKTGA